MAKPLDRIRRRLAPPRAVVKPPRDSGVVPLAACGHAPTLPCMDPIARRRFFEDRVFLAPLTQGGNLPFRRLCVEFGAVTTCSEMALARAVVRGKRSEMALLRRAPEEPCFGVQLAGRHPEELGRATVIAVERGADFVDLNLGCPIDLFCRKGIGAALLEKPRRVHDLVAAMRAATDRPLTAKIRLGYRDDKPRYCEIARAAQEAGADAIVLHGRSRTQRYKRAADWEAVARLVEELEIPVIGNGDLLTWRDVRRRRRETGCAGVMLGRGALIKPWVFREILEDRDHLLGPHTRLQVVRRYRDLALEHFGHDARGRDRVRRFLVFHLDFFSRYRPRPSAEITEGDHPLIQTRIGPEPTEDPCTAWLVSDRREDHQRLADALLAERASSEDRGPAPDDPGAPRWSARGAWSILDEPTGTSVDP